ncbi:unnamed protein product [Discosporangium mesarthrocarpum]
MSLCMTNMESRPPDRGSAVLRRFTRLLSVLVANCMLTAHGFVGLTKPCVRGWPGARGGLLRSNTIAMLAGVDDKGGAFGLEETPGRALAAEEPKLAAFENWADHKGLKRAGLVHADFGGLRGLMTEGSIKPWETLASIPLSDTLVEEAIPLNPACPPPPEGLSAESWQCFPWWVRLGVRLLKEWADGDESRLAPYVGILPRRGTQGTPLHWSAEQLGRLHYPYLLTQVSLQRRLFARFRELILTGATQPCDDSSVSDPQGPNTLLAALGDPGALDWALECTLGRAFQLPPKESRPMTPPRSIGDDGFEGADEKDSPASAPVMEPPPLGEARMALLPLMDSMNHYSRVPTHMHWEDDASIGVAVGSSFDPGDHVFLSYGDVSNDDLLQYYGFVERDNPHDVYVLQDMGRWLKEDGWLRADLSKRLLSCPEAREAWRYLRRGVLLREAVHPTTMQAIRILSCEAGATAVGDDAADGVRPWDGSARDLSRFSAPVSLASEVMSWELVMHCAAREADEWGAAGVAGAMAPDPSAPGLDGDLDGVVGLDEDRRLMLSVFRQEKLGLLRGVVSRLGHLRKVSGLLNRPVEVPVMKSPPVLGRAAGVISVPQ